MNRESSSRTGQTTGVAPGTTGTVPGTTGTAPYLHRGPNTPQQSHWCSDGAVPVVSGEDPVVSSAKPVIAGPSR
ncbi:hypothetical protein DPMN_062206 [Dreissena polymorpha]|uniref:Uncharacterized protein n=1 Tax=Dreissena polymorpha TaxID=45954 RepID=A0A9D4HJ39_DREPO|nr:hypothetical protein DPMN_062206 [Dreissena polymorpha]